MKAIRRRYCNGGWWPTTPEIGLLNPARMRTTRYRYRGTAIPTSVAGHGMDHHDGPRRDLWRARCRDGTQGSGGDPRKRAGRKASTAPWVDLTPAFLRRVPFWP